MGLLLLLLPIACSGNGGALCGSGGGARSGDWAWSGAGVGPEVAWRSWAVGLGIRVGARGLKEQRHPVTRFARQMWRTNLPEESVTGRSAGERKTDGEGR